MNRTDAPAKQPKPFGINGQREDILPTTPAGDNTASYESGFPPITMILKSAGGLPPKGQDMNQILYELSSLCRWFSTGAINSFDSSFASQIGGYPKGSLVLGDDGATLFLSSMDANSNNPNSVSTGWINFTKLVSIASLAGGANKLPYFTGTNTAAQTDLTAFARTVLAQTDGAGVRNTIGVYNATTSQSGIVRLNGGVTDDDNTLAATSAAVKIAYDAATAPALGKGQTLQDLKTSRGTGVTYTNSTGFPIAVFVRITGSTSANLIAYVNGIEFGGGGSIASQTSVATAFFIVPNGMTYRVDASGVSTVLQAWTEMR